ncbi:TPM domain-containing protein [Paludibacterium paludis]|uniref:Lipoprotein n=1 Tax=Paludibacterium paludis TaxID=1225769 RepID=A0A918NXP8_9NEIS|nr:TPM domain-containing protein [Paludibacterium paludis]GGY03336.1 lipoprotein [Paludibacterium paludis]
MMAIRLVFLIAAWVFAVFAHAEVPVPEPVSPVIDTAGFLADSDRQSLANELLAFRDRQGSQIAVLIVPSVAPETAFDYGVRVMENWKPGRKGVDDGVLLLVVVNERTSQIFVGRGLEGTIPDVVAKRILHDILSPRLAAGQRGQGLMDAVKAIESATLKEGLPAPPPRAKQSAGGTDADWSWAALILLFAGGVLRSLFGHVAGSVITGSLIGGVAFAFGAGFFMALLIGGGGFLFSLLGINLPGFGGWGGGGGRGGGGNGGGGWGRGGGDYGGGGASDKW